MNIKYEEVNNWDALKEVLEADKRILELGTYGVNGGDKEKLVQEIEMLEWILKRKENKG